jgi:superfamily I DNA/RNA helicase
MDKEFVKDFNPTIIELNENYRSSIAVLQAAQQLIPDASQIEHTVKLAHAVTCIKRSPFS